MAQVTFPVMRGERMWDGSILLLLEEGSLSINMVFFGAPLGEKTLAGSVLTPQGQYHSEW
jgi:hypothetical protein